MIPRNMIPVLTVFVTVLISLMSSSLQAKPFGATLCVNDSEFSCQKIHRGESWESLFPNPERRDLVMRLNRMNIRLEPGMTIAIPHSSDLNQLSYAPLPAQINAPGEKIILVSFNALAFGAYNSEGRLVYWGPISNGRGYCSDEHRACHTSVGDFRIYRKGGEHCVSTKFPIGRGGAPMPYCMYFNGGFALHGSYEVPGYPDSHGCVRLFVNDAKWLSEEFVQDDNVAVIIRSKNF